MCNFDYPMVILHLIWHRFSSFLSHRLELHTFARNHVFSSRTPCNTRSRLEQEGTPAKAVESAEEPCLTNKALALKLEHQQVRAVYSTPQSAYMTLYITPRTTY